jgi:hypothetical protein
MYLQAKGTANLVQHMYKMTKQTRSTGITNGF